MRAVAMASDNSPNSDDGREMFAAYINDEKIIKVLTPIVSEYGWDPKRIQKGGVASAVRALGVVPSPHLLIVDISDSKDPLGDVSALEEVCEQSTLVLALGTKNDVTLYRDLIQLGIHDYLVKPVKSETLKVAISDAFLTIHNPEAGSRKKLTGNKMCAIIGARGGVGASLFATSIAWIIANQQKSQTALLDLDFFFGTSALTFDLEPGRGLSDALDNPDRVDDLFIQRATVQASERLSLLGLELPLSEPLQVDPEALTHLIEKLRESFGYLVLDVPRDFASRHGYFLQNANHVIIVTELSLAATRDTIRLLAFLKEVAPEIEVIIAVNKSGSGFNEEVNLKDFESSIEHKVHWNVPFDPKATMEAVTRGKALPQVADKSKLVKVLQEISATLTGKKKQAEKKKAGWAPFKKEKVKA